jgi:Protein of unknown function (DUF2783)
MSTSGQISPTALRLDQPMLAADDFYEALLDAHQGLSLEESTALNARLVLLLAHQVGDIESLRACLAAARR